MSADLLTTPLHALHLELGARMVPFAGHAMPVQYREGILAEHRHTRAAAGLFDVSHMGQIRLAGPEAAAALESLVPMDIVDLPVGKQRYALFLDERAGILDDLMVTRRPEDLFLIVNAACRAQDLAHLQRHIGQRCQVEALPGRALLALQGPLAVAVLAALNPGVSSLTFMTGARFELAGTEAFVTRSGYTGEDGFEISVPGDQAEALARALLRRPEVRPIGLGARDTLRLEAGLCLHGHDIGTDTSPVEAGLAWALQKVRRAGGARAGGYPGSAVVDQQLLQGAGRRRVGLVGLERVPVREGAVLVDEAGSTAGRVTSGSISPSLNQAVAMAYVDIAHAVLGHRLFAQVRERQVPMQVCALPFVPQRYHRA